MTDKIINLGIETNDARKVTPLQLLEDAIEMVKNPKSSFSTANKMIIIVLNDKDDSYRVNWSQCGMGMSQCVLVCEVAKVTFLSELGYIKP